MSKYLSHVEANEASPEGGIELERMLERTSSKGTDDKDMIRLGKRPVLKVCGIRRIILKCL